MTKAQYILTQLSRAIARGERLTRKEWAHRLDVCYGRFCAILNEHKHEFGLLQAIRDVRADRSTGVIQTTKYLRRCNRRWVDSIRVPACAIAAAGFDSLAEVSYRAEKGRIVLTPASQTRTKEKP